MVSPRIKLTALTAPLIAVAVCIAAAGTMSYSAEAQYSIKNEQPAAGRLHLKEAQLEAELTDAYQIGLIGPLQLATLRRDLDAIRAKEDSYCARPDGLTSGRYYRIANRLAMFEAHLMHDCDKAAVVIAAPVIEYR